MNSTLLKITGFATFTGFMSLVIVWGHTSFPIISRSNQLAAHDITRTTASPMDDGEPVIVFGLPVLSGGSQGSCPDLMLALPTISKRLHFLAGLLPPIQQFLRLLMEAAEPIRRLNMWANSATTAAIRVASPFLIRLSVLCIGLPFIFRPIPRQLITSSF